MRTYMSKKFITLEGTVLSYGDKYIKIALSPESKCVEPLGEQAKHIKEGNVCLRMGLFTKNWTSVRISDHVKVGVRILCLYETPVYIWDAMWISSIR